MRGIRRAAALLLVLVLVGVACGSDSESGGTTGGEATGATNGAATGEPIIIGHVLGETGFMQYYDVPAHQAATLAIEDINARGGVLGRPLSIIKFNMETDPPLGVGGVETMLDQGAEILFAPGDLDTAAPALTTANDQQKVIVSVEGSDWTLGLFGPYVYSMGLASNVQGAAGAEWAYQVKGWRSSFVLVDVTIAITKSEGQFFIQRWEELGGSLAGVETFQNDDPSIAAQITAIKNADPQPDFIHLSSFIPGSAGAIKQIRDAGIDLPILCQISCGEGLDWLEGIPGLTDFYYTNMGYVYGPGDPNPDVWALAQRFEAEFGEPMQLSLDLAGYAAVEIIAWAIDQAGSTDQAAIKAALDSATQVPTILGPVSFTPDFHMMYDIPVRIEQILDGEQLFVETWVPEEVDLVGANLPDL